MNNLIYMRNIIRPFLIAFSLLSTNFIASQTICTAGFAGAYPCDGYDLLSNISIATLANISGSPEGSDIWGWTDPLDGDEYAIIATTNSTAFVNVTDPINPVFLGRIDTETSTSFWRDVKVYNNHAFIVADGVGSHGMQVFDLTRLRNVVSPPVTFTTDTLFTDVGSCHNIMINESSGYAYLVGCNTFSGGPVFVDISDPLNPVGDGGYSADGYTHDAQIVTYNGPDSDYTGKEILIASNGVNGGTNIVVILDVTDKSNPVKISSVSYSNSRYTHQGWFTEDQRYFILGDELDEFYIGNDTRTIILDFNDLDNPVYHTDYSGNSAAIDHNGYVLGNTFYLSNYRAGLRVFDISNIASTTSPMTEIGYFDTYPANDGTDFNGTWSVYPYFASGNIIISDIEGGLFVVRKSGTLNITEENIEEAFIITPNPTTENPKIIAKQNQKINQIEVYNLLGQKMFSQDNLNLAEFVLPIKTFSKGIYFVKINSFASKRLILK
jgi:choice-of-anchor B domain-containing protein